METKVNLRIRGIQHIGIPVTNIINSEKFYTSLGFNNIMKSGFPSEGETGIAIMMQKDGVIIELYEMPGSQLEEIRQRKDGHIDHIAFDVGDINIIFAELKEAGFQIEDQEPVHLDFWKNGCKYFTMIGPDGERLEFNQKL
jgi:lactoylglutathione lyase